MKKHTVLHCLRRLLH